MEIYFKKAKKTQDDALYTMILRNDKTAREMSIHQEKKEWSLFFKEYRTEYISQDSELYFVSVNNEKVGYVRYRKYKSIPNAWDISINLDVNFRGKGYGKMIVREAINLYFNNHIGTLIAEIKPENISSHQIFLANGFKYMKTIEYPAELKVYSKDFI